MQIIELSPSEVTTLMERLSHADLHGDRVRVAFESGLKVKIGEGMWTPPLGKAEVRN